MSMSEALSVNSSLRLQFGPGRGAAKIFQRNPNSVMVMHRKSGREIRFYIQLRGWMVGCAALAVALGVGGMLFHAARQKRQEAAEIVRQLDALECFDLLIRDDFEQAVAQTSPPVVR